MLQLVTGQSHIHEAFLFHLDKHKNVNFISERMRTLPKKHCKKQKKTNKKNNNNNTLVHSIHNISDHFNCIY